MAGMTPEELCAAYAARVARFASLVAGADADPDDVSQDALVKAMGSLGRYDPTRGPIEAWLWRIVVNTARDATRRARVRALVTERLSRPTESVDVEAIVLERLTTAEIYRAAARLAPRDRELLALRFASDLSTAEVGEIVGLSAESARRAIGRALDRLRHILAGDAR